MVLTKEFIGIFHQFNIRCHILSKILGFEITNEHEGIDIPLLQHWDNNPFSSNSNDHRLIYDGYIFYCIGNRESTDLQVNHYLSLRRDDIIDDILE